ncbi:MAG: hypothetical protein WBD34_19165, partial [Burkholderiaceae bacterium]
SRRGLAALLNLNRYFSNAGAETQMMSILIPVGNEFIRFINSGFIAVSGYVPHDNFVAAVDSFSPKVYAPGCGSAKIDNRALIANRFRDKTGHQVSILQYFSHSSG